MISNRSKPSMLGKRVIVEPLDTAGLQYTTGLTDNGSRLSPSSPDSQDSQLNGSHRGSQRSQCQENRCRQRVTFTGVPPPRDKANDENIEDCIVIANTIQVEIMDEAGLTDVEGMQPMPQDMWQDESNSRLTPETNQ